MHSRIIELSHESIKAAERITESDVPEWFFATVCDYAVPSGQREQDIDWFTGNFRGLCSRNGKQIWLLAKMPDVEIAGDAVEPYLCFTNSHDGASGVRVCMTPIRVVCNNTLNMALSTAKRTWSLRHTESIHDRWARPTAENAASIGLAGNLRHVPPFSRKTLQKSIRQ